MGVFFAVMSCKGGDFRIALTQFLLYNKMNKFYHISSNEIKELVENKILFFAIKDSVFNKFAVVGISEIFFFSSR